MYDHKNPPSFVENFKIFVLLNQNSHIIYPEHIFAIIVPFQQQIKIVSNA